MTIKVSGGGGGLPPGITGNNQTPGGLNIAGALTAGPADGSVSIFHSIYGALLTRASHMDYENGQNPLSVLQLGTLDPDEGSMQPSVIGRYVDRNSLTVGNPVFLLLARDASGGATPIPADEPVFQANADTHGDGFRTNAAGFIGLGGATPPTAPRTLPQATITAITDANAKAAVQALANALSDMGALTLT